MTDQLQSSRDQGTPPAGRPEQTDHDRTGPPSSTQDSTALDSTDAGRPADDGTVYRSAGHDSVVDQTSVDESVAEVEDDDTPRHGTQREIVLDDEDIERLLSRRRRRRGQKRTVRVEGGCTWGDVDQATHAFGLATPS